MDQQSLLNLLAKTPAFTAVPKGDLKLILANLEVISLSSDEAFPLKHDVQPSYMLPLRGRLVLRKEHVDQPYPICIWLAVGGLWPVHRTSTPKITLSIEPIGAGLLGFLTDRGFKNVRDASSSLRLAFVRSIGLGLEQVINQYSRCLNVPLSTQLARLLLELQEIKNGESVVHFKHWQIANLLSTYRETVSCLIGEFRQQGWVETGTGRIQLLDLPKLTEMAELY